MTSETAAAVDHLFGYTGRAFDEANRARENMRTALTELSRRATAARDAVFQFRNNLPAGAPELARGSQRAADAQNTLARSDRLVRGATQSVEYMRRLVSIDPNHMNHIFQQKHNLDSLVNRCSDKVNAYFRILDAATRYFRERPRLLADARKAGNAVEATIDVAGQQVTVTMKYIDNNLTLVNACAQ
ncbi:MAG: hypothetical protein DWQ31_19850 [Planctomycetota bacterium]|nr:MAG: hypothetical protein DWQ31_19850 [Planctomycetota bacterium]